MLRVAAHALMHIPPLDDRGYMRCDRRVRTYDTVVSCPLDEVERTRTDAVLVH